MLNLRNSHVIVADFMVEGSINMIWVQRLGHDADCCVFPFHQNTWSYV